MRAATTDKAAAALIKESDESAASLVDAAQTFSGEGASVPNSSLTTVLAQPVRSASLRETHESASPWTRHFAADGSAVFVTVGWWINWSFCLQARPI